MVLTKDPIFCHRNRGQLGLDVFSMSRLTVAVAKGQSKRSRFLEVIDKLNLFVSFSHFVMLDNGGF